MNDHIEQRQARPQTQSVADVMLQDAYSDLGKAWGGITHAASGLFKLAEGASLKKQEIEGACGEAVAKGAVKAAQVGGKVAETAGILTVKVAAGAAYSAVEGGRMVAQKAGEAGRELNKENPELANTGKAVSDAAGGAARAIGGALGAAAARDRDFHRDRPLDAKVAGALGLDHVIGAAVGGLGHGAAKEVQRPVAAKPENAQSQGNHQAAEMHITAAVKAGDSYWTIARAHLGPNSRNTDIARESERISKLNGGKNLNPGDNLRIL